MLLDYTLHIHSCPILGTTSSQAPSYASPKLSPTESLTGVKCRGTSEAKKYEIMNKKIDCERKKYKVYTVYSL